MECNACVLIDFDCLASNLILFYFCVWIHAVPSCKGPLVLSPQRHALSAESGIIISVSDWMVCSRKLFHHNLYSFTVRIETSFFFAGEAAASCFRIFTLQKITRTGGLHSKAVPSSIASCLIAQHTTIHSTLGLSTSIPGGKFKQVKISIHHP